MKEIIYNIEIQLKILGYEIRDTDICNIEYLMNKHISQIKYLCGIDEINESLSYLIVDRVCAEFLKNKISLGEELDITIENSINSIKIGDVSVDFPNNSSNEEKLSLILERLERNDFDYSPYSKMR